MSQNRPNVESAINSLLQQPSASLDTETLNQKHANLLNARSIVQQMCVEEDSILHSKTLSTQGKQEKRKEFAEKVIQQFAPLGRVRAQLAVDQTGRKQVMLAPITKQPAGNEIVNHLRDAELRSQLQRLTQSEKSAAFLRALGSDDLDTTRAMLTAPGPKWIAADIQTRGELEYAQRTNPVVFEKYQSVEHLEECLQAVAEMIRQWLVELGANEETVVKTLSI